MQHDVSERKSLFFSCRFSFPFSRSLTLNGRVNDNERQNDGEHGECLVTASFCGVVMADAEACYSDSLYVPKFVQKYLGWDVDECFERLSAQAPWTDPSDLDFRYRGHELPRQKAFLVRSEGRSSSSSSSSSSSWPVDVNVPPDPLRKYRYPGFQYGSMLHYRPLQAAPVVQDLSNALQDHLQLDGQPVTVNHVICTRYRDSGDHIGFHSDKVADIADGAPILSLSFGETRELHIARNDDLEKPRVLTLEAGDLFVLGYKTNLAYKHAIVPVAQERAVKRHADDDDDDDDDGSSARVGARISLVFRNISTLVALEDVRSKAAKTRAERNKKRAKKNEEGGEL